MVLHVEDQAGVRTLTLDSPGKKNALDASTLLTLRDVLLETGADESVRVVRLQGAGEDFCSGSDMTEARAAHPLRRLRRFNEAVEALVDLPQPVVARVDGVAVGAGLSLALASDLVVASKRARFCAIFTRRGMSPDAGCSWLLTHTVGLLQAKRLTLLADMVGAQEALALGLATYVVEPADLDLTVEELCGRLAAGPPIGLAQSKALLNRSAHGSLHDVLWQEAAAQTVNFATDAPDAIAAYRNRTEPSFGGTFRVDQTQP
ncbi:enoyl-CoA hydratase/isomerase family protein [Flexivirga oryzae]|uniref:2-(1,2-epoxy-1,2-dihydrophenyl)acetyl-CoA isomerase n=1 Tax=Flexivirga oryzae TaxID=1794944 RepID=A0A839N8M6_9MICO|nr:enoyl-CoA hydratase-related protein [Flexivirga oryzae]MBB2893577.1 2-(1,2-epoxy-1,2-dihydrophenyl)acetyl-CoA isomerase [Flexivirga oryzae]